MIYRTTATNSPVTGIFVAAGKLVVGFAKVAPKPRRQRKTFRRVESIAAFFVVLANGVLMALSKLIGGKIAVGEYGYPYRWIGGQIVENVGDIHACYHALAHRIKVHALPSSV